MAVMPSISLTPPRAAVLVFLNCPISKSDSSNERSMGNMAARVAILMAKKAEMRIKPLSATKSRTTREPLHLSNATDTAAMVQNSEYWMSEAFILSSKSIPLSRMLGKWIIWAIVYDALLYPIFSILLKLKFSDCLYPAQLTFLLLLAPLSSFPERLWV